MPDSRLGLSEARLRDVLRLAVVGLEQLQVMQSADADIWIVGPDWRLNLTQLKRDHDSFRQALVDIVGWERWQTPTWRDIARAALEGRRASSEARDDWRATVGYRDGRDDSQLDRQEAGGARCLTPIWANSCAGFLGTIRRL